MAWYWIALIIYCGIGFLIGLFAAIVDFDGGGVAYIVPCVFIGFPLLIIGIFQWLLEG